MDFMQFAFKQAVAYHFGENANVTPLLLSYVKVWMALNVNASPAQLNEAARELEMEIDKIMPKTNSLKRNKHLVMKAYTHLIRGGFSTKFDPCTMRVEDSEKALKLLEPIKFTTEGIFAYIVALQNSVRILMAQGLDNSDKEDKALQYLEEAEELFEKFKEKYPLDFDQKALNFSQIFGVIRTGKCMLLSVNHLHTIIFLSNYSYVVDNKEMQLKYAVPVIIARLTIESPDFHQTIPPIAREIRSFFSQYHFAQVNHLLSVLMFLLVKQRRSLPDKQKHKVNNAQARVSHWFALWASQLVDYSLKWCEDPNSHEKEFPINSNVIHLEKFVEPGIEIYEDQFPCEPLVANKDFKKVFKKATAWCQRALDMYDGCPDEEFDATLTMKQIVKFQQTIENSSDLL